MYQYAAEHFKTITHHRHLVMKYCFRVGLYKQGLLHDLSKYSPTEFLVGAKYFQGYRSPNNAEREDKGYSSSWLHHKGRNKHHFEYWIDYSGKADPVLSGMQMPVKYAVEMVMDRIAACQNYQKEDYTDQSPLVHYMKAKDRHIIHPKTREILEDLLTVLADRGMEATYARARKLLKEDKRERRRKRLEKIGRIFR